MNMIVLVTGGSGFIGSHLAEHLLSRGHTVRCLVRKTSNVSVLNDKQVELYYGDILHPESIEPAVKGAGMVYHLAAAMTGDYAREDFFRVNVSGTRNLLDACTRFASDCAKFVYVSSISASGPRHDMTALTEDSPCRPVDCYGESKLQAEETVLQYRSKVPLVIIRPPLVYGPGDKNPLTVLRHMRMVSRGFYIVRGSEKRYTSIIYVRDLAEGLVLAGESIRSGGQTYFMCNEKPVTYEDICQLTAKALQKKAVRIRIPSFIFTGRKSLLRILDRLMKTERLKRIDRPPHWICDGSKAHKELGFFARTPLPDGIRDTALWYKEHGWL